MRLLLVHDLEFTTPLVCDLDFTTILGGGGGPRHPWQARVQGGPKGPAPPPLEIKKQKKREKGQQSKF